MSGPARDDDPGYRPNPAGGASVRADIVEVHVFRRPAAAAPGGSAEIELLQLHRTGGPLAATWQPIMGHVEAGEHAVDAAIREMREEVALATDDAGFVAMWALEQVHPYYLADLDCIVMSPRFAVEAAPGWEPKLDHEHDDKRWIFAPLHGGLPAQEFFMWPGQRVAVTEVLEIIARPGAPARDRLRIDPHARRQDRG